MYLNYNPLEKLIVSSPVDRIKYLSRMVTNKTVLDLGCYDETAITAKIDTGLWLHQELTKTAKFVKGLDNSKKYQKMDLE